MDNVLAAFITLFITLFAALSLTSTVISAQETLRTASAAVQTRVDLRSRTALSVVSATVASDGGSATLVIRNDGSVKLTDYFQWDIFLQYMDNQTASGYHVKRLTASEWSFNGLYLDAAQSRPEIYDRSIFNPGESLKLSVNLMPPLGKGKTAQVVIATQNGVDVTAQMTRNDPPELTTNIGISAAVGEQVVIDKTALDATDADTAPDALVYTIVRFPAQGTLSLSSTFTQADLNDGKQIYSRMVIGNVETVNDSFSFILSDGQTTVGPFTFALNP
jgi:archaellum component FlaF (FlaF/FlaG flagellin family)